MKLEYDVIRDLLPLYAEKLASPASSALVEQHLAECPACRAQLEQMEKPVPVQPEPQPDAPLRSIRKTLQKKSIRIAAAAVLAVLCAFGLVFWMGGAKTPVTAEQAQIWTYNKKENEANLCVLEVQGENVRLEEVNAEYRRLSVQQDTPEADIRRVLAPETVAAALAAQKVQRFLLDNAVVTSVMDPDKE